MRSSSPSVQRAAQLLRSNPTPAEAALWKALRFDAVDGLRFRRQHVVDRFLDFYCASRKLCIELDGSIHDEQADRDAARSALLRLRGITVIRFRNEEVLDDLPAVLRSIRAAAERLRPPGP